MIEDNHVIRITTLSSDCAAANKRFRSIEQATESEIILLAMAPRAYLVMATTVNEFERGEYCPPHHYWAITPVYWAITPVVRAKRRGKLLVC